MKTQAFSTGYPVSGFVSGQKLSGNIRLSGIRQIAIRCTPNNDLYDLFVRLFVASSQCVPILELIHYYFY